MFDITFLLNALSWAIRQWLFWVAVVVIANVVILALFAEIKRREREIHFGKEMDK